jgi:hypothetical protein
MAGYDRGEVRHSVLGGMALGLGVASVAVTATLAVWGGGGGGVQVWWALPVLIGAAVLAGTLFRRPGFVAEAALLAGVAVALLGHRLAFEPNPVVDELETPGDPDSRRLTHVDDALLAEGVPSQWRAFAALVCLALVVALVLTASRLTWWNRARLTDAPVPATGSTRRWFAAGLAAALVLTAVAWTAARPVRDWTARRIVAHGAQLEVFGSPRRDPDLLEVTSRGWRRQGLQRALAAGEVVVGVEIRGAADHDEDADTALSAVVGLRPEDGAELWRYTVEGSEGQQWIRAVVVDPEANTALVVVRNVLVGLDLDGGIRYTRALRPHDDLVRWTLTTGSPDYEPPSKMTLASVAVLAGVQGPLFEEVVGVDVATGQVLWREDVPALCRVAAVNPRMSTFEPSPPPSRTAIVAMTGGDDACTDADEADPLAGLGNATVTRYDGSDLRWRTALTPPSGLEHPEAFAPQAAFNPWGLAAPTTDQVLVEVDWSGRRNGEYTAEWRLVALDARGEVTADVDSNVVPLVEGSPVTVGNPGGETFVAVPVSDVATAEDQEARSGWILLEHDLSVEATVPAAGAADVAIAYGEIGRLLFEYRYQVGEITLRDRTSELPVVETVRLADDDRCADGSTRLDGDDRILVVSCDSGDVTRTVAYSLDPDRS